MIKFVFLGPSGKAMCAMCERYLAVVVDPDDPTRIKEYVCVLCDQTTPATEVHLAHMC